MTMRLCWAVIPWCVTLPASQIPRYLVLRVTSEYHRRGLYGSGFRLSRAPSEAINRLSVFKWMGKESENLEGLASIIANGRQNVWEIKLKTVITANERCCNYGLGDGGAGEVTLAMKHVMSKMFHVALGVDHSWNFFSSTDSCARRLPAVSASLEKVRLEVRYVSSRISSGPVAAVCRVCSGSVTADPARGSATAARVIAATGHAHISAPRRHTYLQSPVTVCRSSQTRRGTQFFTCSACALVLNIPYPEILRVNASDWYSSARMNVRMVTSRRAVCGVPFSLNTAKSRMYGVVSSNHRLSVMTHCDK
ncbi:hypothetical protein J6590_012971 [Homalodisca vitripennis]|nr:hypothetical protein J6590_012971 [Homalodisca vitripennis]